MTTRLFSTDTDSGTITVLERSEETGELRAIESFPIGNGPRGAVRFTAAGSGFVSNSCGDTISEIDAVSCREVDQIKVGIAPTGVAVVPGDRFVLASNSGSNDISVVDLRSRKEVTRVPVGREPKHMDITPNGRAAYVAVFGADYVAKLDLRSLLRDDPQVAVRETKRIPVGKNARPYSVGIGPTGAFAYVANNQANYVSVIDLSADTVVDRVPVGHKGARGVAFDPTGKTAFVSVEDTSEVVAIDTSSREIIRRLEGGPGPRGMVVDASAQSIFVSAFARTDTPPTSALRRPNSVSVIDLSENGLDSVAEGTPRYESADVGAGPCSVSIYEIPE